MNDILSAAFNQAVKREFEAAYGYKAMALWLRHYSLDGMAHWMDIQSKEEMEHADKIVNYIDLRDSKVQLLEISKPKEEFKSVLEVFEDVLKMERQVSSWILELRTLASNQKDDGAVLFLDWFITEQEQEEHCIQELLGKFAVMGITHEVKNGFSLFAMDKELSSR